MQKQAVREEKLFNFRPAFFLVIALCFGILISYAIQFQGLSVFWLLIVSPFVLAPVLLWFCKKLTKKILGMFLILVLGFAIGVSVFFLHYTSYTKQKVFFTPTQITGTIINKTENNDYCVVTLNDLTLQDERAKGKLIAYLPASFFDSVRLGDRLVLVSALSNTGKDASVYEWQHDIRYYTAASKVEIGEHTFKLFLTLRERVEKVLYEGMDKTNASVSVGLLLGDVSNMDKNLLQNVRYGGIAHIFAVSGLHVGALFGACLLLFEKTKCKHLQKPLRFVFVAAILLFYGGLCGYSASVIRAIVMCLTGYAVSLIGLGYDATETLAYAAIVVLLLSPVSLFAVGFQLSFMACLGIIWFARPMERTVGRWLGYEKEKRGAHPLSVKQRVVRSCVSVVCVSICATVMTAPITLNAFGYFSGWSLLLNFLLTPLIGVSFVAMLSFVSIACLLPTAVSAFVLYLPYVFWSIFLLIFQIFDFSSLMISGVSLPSVAVIGYYAGCIFLTDKWNMPKKYSLVLSVLCFLAFLAVTIACNL